MTIDITPILNNPEALSKVCEAIGSAYYSSVLDKTVGEMMDLGKLYGQLFKINPNWRMICKDLPPHNWAEKYKHITDATTSLPIK